MKKSVIILLHSVFWLSFPLSTIISNWAGEFGTFSHMMGNHKGFWSIVIDSFQFLIEPPDKGNDFYSDSNLIGIIFNFYLYIILPIGLFYASYIVNPISFKNGSLKLKIKELVIILFIPLIITTVFKFFTIRVAFEYPFFVAMSYIYVIPFASFGVIFRLIENWVTKEKSIKQNLQSELSLLKNQINPHFLFNTLNNIDSLIKSNVDRASETLVKLSEILRYMIYDTNVDKALLSNEIKHIVSYVDLQKIQFANKELVTLSTHGKVDNLMISPMLFIPFVENAFKHCNVKNIQNAIRINFSIDNKMVIFECNNLFDKTQKITKDNASGIGLNIIKRRLELLYPDRHTLIINEADNNFRVSLSINTNEN